MDVAQVKQLLAALPGGPPPATSPFARGSVFDTAKFEALTDEAKCELAKFFVLDSCPRIGSFASNGDAGYFLGSVAAELNRWPQGSDISSRRLQHVAFAVSHSLAFVSPQGALSATYLLHQLEFLFRALSGALTLEGVFISHAAKAAVENGLGRKMGGRVNDIVDTYEIMRLNTAFLAPRLFAELDAQLGGRWAGPYTYWPAHRLFEASCISRPACGSVFGGCVLCAFRGHCDLWLVIVSEGLTLERGWGHNDPISFPRRVGRRGQRAMFPDTFVVGAPHAGRLPKGFESVRC